MSYTTMLLAEAQTRELTKTSQRNQLLRFPQHNSEAALLTLEHVNLDGNRIKESAVAALNVVNKLPKVKKDALIAATLGAVLTVIGVNLDSMSETDPSWLKNMAFIGSRVINGTVPFSDAMKFIVGISYINITDMFALSMYAYAVYLQKDQNVGNKTKPVKK